MSADLQWLVLKNNNSFLVKRDGAQFSSEPGNLMNLNSYKFSGLANAKTVDVREVDGKITLTTKKTKKGAARKPASSFARTQLNKHMRNKSCAGAEVVKGLTEGSYYRADLTKFAVGRYHAVYNSIHNTTEKKAERKARGAKKA